MKIPANRNLKWFLCGHPIWVNPSNLHGIAASTINRNFVSYSSAARLNSPLILFESSHQLLLLNIRFFCCILQYYQSPHPHSPVQKHPLAEVKLLADIVNTYLFPLPRNSTSSVLCCCWIKHSMYLLNTFFKKNIYVFVYVGSSRPHLGKQVLMVHAISDSYSKIALDIHNSKTTSFIKVIYYV